MALFSGLLATDGDDAGGSSRKLARLARTRALRRDHGYGRADRLVADRTGVVEDAASRHRSVEPDRLERSRVPHGRRGARAGGTARLLLRPRLRPGPLAQAALGDRADGLLLPQERTGRSDTDHRRQAPVGLLR